MITFGNDGAGITSTNYWDTEYAAAGLCYLNGNAGVLRLLVPEAAEGLLAEMRTGKQAAIERSIAHPEDAWDIVFEDGTESPFALTLDKRHADLAMPPGSCTLAVWTQRGKQFELKCEVKS